MEKGEPNPEGSLSLQLLKSKSNEFEVESIHTISLSQLRLDNISVIECCVGLERLDLSYNDINQLQPLSSLTHLLTLDLSANRITTLNGLQTLEKLERLNVAGNLLGSVDVLKSLASLQSLRYLRLHDSLKDLSNPFYMRHSYKADILRLLPGLQHLDGEIVKGPGSEVFTLMAELDREASSKFSSGKDGPIKRASPPLSIPCDLFTLRKREESEQDVVAEQQFKNSLELCAALSDKSSKLIAQAEQKLKAREKV